MPTLDVLLVDDERTIRLAVGDAIRDAGHRLTVASDGGEAQALISAQVFDVVICDIRLPKVDGLTLFRRLRELAPSTDVILITAYGAVSDAVSALKEGAHDYLLKPFETDEILLRLERIQTNRRLRQELDAARAELRALGSGLTLVGRSPQMAKLRQRIEAVAPSDAAVLITGETGTGKELVARSVHELSSRGGKPFVAVSCAAFPETLLEAELFGHEKGAFTGAARRRPGRFQAADGGTLFLDEVAEMSPEAQAKLLRVLEQGAVEPLGSNASIPVDVRVLSATHRDLRNQIAAGRFREDIYYRLNVIEVRVPSLRERRGDIPVLVEHFLRRFTPDGQEPPRFSPRAWAALSTYPFPGNVRELEHAVQHAVVLASGPEVDLAHLPADIADTVSGEETREDSIRPLSAAVGEFERSYLLRALRLSAGKKSQAAELLGISRKNLWEKMRAHHLDDSDLEE